MESIIICATVMGKSSIIRGRYRSVTVLAEKNSSLAASHKDGVYEDDFKGERRKVIVNTISYTGWKLVGVIPYSAFIHGMIDVRYFIILLMLLTVMVLCSA